MPFLCKSYISFFSGKLARSTLKFLIDMTFNRSPFNANFLSASRKVKKVSYNVTGIVLFIRRSFILFESGSFTSLSWLVYSGVVILVRGDSKYEANLPLLLIISKSLLFKYASAFLFSLYVSAIVFVTSWGTVLIVVVMGWYNFFVSQWKFWFPSLSCNLNAFTWL